MLKKLSHKKFLELRTSPAQEQVRKNAISSYLSRMFGGLMWELLSSPKFRYKGYIPCY